MKILKLRFKNLNSLYGEWSIDFRDPQYSCGGIFAITGPTGSGKSTILDAICLALYGSTPRLGRISQTSNEIMSRRTGDCYSEVTFQSREEIFTCHWSQHRAYKKPDGKLADAKHEIFAEDGKIMESKKRDVLKVIEEITGMDFDRFTRSILLAQGGFDSFLKASSSERAPILEQITGTEIYSEISMKVHDRKREEESRLDELKITLSSIKTLSDQDRSELNNNISEKEGLCRDLTAKVDKLDRSINWLESISKLEEEKSLISSSLRELSSSIESFQGESEKLDRAEKAYSMEKDFKSLTKARDELEINDRRLKETEEEIVDLKNKLSAREKDFVNLDESLREAKELQIKNVPILREVRAIDRDIEQIKSEIDSSDIKRDKERSRLDGLVESEKKGMSSLSDKEEDLKEIEDYLDKHRDDELLLEEMSGIKEALKSLETERLELDQLGTSFNDMEERSLSLEDSLKDRERALSDLEDELNSSKERSELLRQDLSLLLGEKLLREYRAEKESLMRELLLLNKIESLEEERQNLVEGKPCPLCGATHHPFSLGTVPAMDENDLRIKELDKIIGRAEDIESELSLQMEEEGRIKSKQSELKISTVEGRKDLERLTCELEKQTASISQKKNLIRNLEGNLSHKICPMGIDLLDDLQSVRSDLQGRLDLWKEKKSLHDELRRSIEDLTRELHTIKSSKDELCATIKDLEEELKSSSEKLEGIKSKRAHIYGDKDPDKEEKSLWEHMEILESDLKDMRDARDELKDQLNKSDGTLATLLETVRSNQLELDSLESCFEMELSKFSFIDEKDYISSLLDRTLYEELKQQRDSLISQEREFKIRLDDIDKKIGKEKAQKVTDSTLDELVEERTSIKDAVKTYEREIGALKQRLEEDRMSMTTMGEKAEELARQRVECDRWSRLHSLIGSSDGKKYRNFAQGITFELMVSHANRELVKMSDRYLLIRDEDQPLELNVMDNYQGGEVRSTKNLSGGESFIVSLSLALGLSKMASRKVSVDSLFLDEGFGTLDEESLETALDTLAGLHEEGKLIGVISHVEALKYRIPTQLELIPRPGGKSTIKGPSCSHG